MRFEEAIFYLTNIDIPTSNWILHGAIDYFTNDE
jgi:hypothetical protein